MIPPIHFDGSAPHETPFLGLAPFLRMNIAGTDLRPVAQEMLTRIERHPDDANLLMNLATVMQCLGQRRVGLAFQAQALALQRIYHLSAAKRPATFRLVMLAVPGDLAANMPLDCLLEWSDIDLDFYYVSPDAPLASPIPEHDALIVGIAESDENRGLLAALAPLLSRWPKPVIDVPQHIPALERTAASRLLQGIPGLRIPPTKRAPRKVLLDIAAGTARLPELFDECEFPIILRPIGSHAGRNLGKIDQPDEITTYLSKVEAPEFFLSPFIDYRGKDGLFRKVRIAFIDGAAYVCHMAISSNWMIHYVNAGMYEDGRKRAEEATFMLHFDKFVHRHRLALDAIYRRTGLEYLLVDCAETLEGQLLVFEIDHTMVVHAMDPEHLFPYKQPLMRQVQDAFRQYLCRLTAPTSPGKHDGTPCPSR